MEYIQTEDKISIRRLGLLRRRAVLKWSLYWIVVFGVYLPFAVMFKSMTMYAFYLVLAAFHCALILAASHLAGRFAGIRTRRAAVRLCRIMATLAVACLGFAVIQKGMTYNEKYIESLDYGDFAHTSSYTYDSDTGVYTVSGTNEEFRILQLTDLHICASISTIFTDRKAYNACYDLIRETKPDLIILTGDMVYPVPWQTFSRNNQTAFYQLCLFLNKIGIPWAMVYGNHDTEKVARYNAEQLSGVYRNFRQSGAPMLYADKQPDIYGRYNQYLRIENSDKSLNRLLFLVDSNDYVPGSRKSNDYDSVHPDQVQWYRDTVDRVAAEEGKTVPSFVFMHIPFRAFADAQEALQNNSPDAVYLFGENGEGVACPDQEFGFFDAILEKQSTEAVFVGHDHLNNMGIKYKGVDLVFSKSIDYYAYPGIAGQTEQRGATLILLSPDGTYRIRQIDYTKPQ